MITKFIDADSNKAIGRVHSDVTLKLYDMFLIEESMYQVVGILPVFNSTNDKTCYVQKAGAEAEFSGYEQRMYVARQKPEKKLDFEHGAEAHLPETNGLHQKYIVVKSDGSPLKDGAEYLVLNIKHDRAAQIAAKVYCDAQTDPKFSEFVNDLRALIMKLRA